MRGPIRHTSKPSAVSSSALSPKQLTKQEFGRRLQALMLERSWNQSDLARNAILEDGRAMGRDAVSSYVNGHSFPSPKSLDALAKAFNLPKEELLPNSMMLAMDAEHPEFELRVAAGHPGKAWVRINRMMSMATATDIARLLNEEDKRDE